MFSIGTRPAETVSPSTRDILSDMPRRQVETDKGGWSETIESGSYGCRCHGPT